MEQSLFSSSLLALTVTEHCSYALVLIPKAQA